MRRPGLMLYGILCYIFFNITFLYMAGFLLDIAVPKAINDGAPANVPVSLAINALLVFLFGLFHSLMARQWFKDRWTRLISVEAERSTYVLQAATFLSLLMLFWKPMPSAIWSVDGVWALVVYAVFLAGLAMVLLSTFLIDHWELFGLRQIWANNVGAAVPRPVFKTPMLYRIVRHPMQLGVILVFFATPVMTAGHLFFAASMTAYVLIGLYFEERSLVREFGATYRDYQRRVPMLCPNPFRMLPRRAQSA
ncbi:MAG: isoprenylcysteine carboxylmethyltransferase family protein [Roseibium sp.]|uniref:methanethiol S-methyltransferase n=1 Tax=Roseibium sp. TaxID=1936156 RepID=UPI003D9C04E0